MRFLLVIGIVIFLGSVFWIQSLQRHYRHEMNQESHQLTSADVRITLEDLGDLPQPVKNYLIHVGVVGKPRVKSFSLTMRGEMKLDKGSPYAPVKADQHTYIASGRRLFWMTMSHKGLPIVGLHDYGREAAKMTIKVLDLFKVVKASGPEMHHAETVTYFNDLCVMAPSALLEESIQWEVIDPMHVKGTLTKHGETVSAILVFNADGMLENFISNDRMAIEKDGTYSQIQWSTPIDSYGMINDYYLPKSGQAIWHYEDGDFPYIKLTFDNVSINQ